MVDIASRIRAKLSRRRHSSTAPSLASSRSAVDETSSVTSQSRSQGHSFGRSCEGSSLGDSAVGKHGDLAASTLSSLPRDDSTRDSHGHSSGRTWEADAHDEDDRRHSISQLTTPSDPAPASNATPARGAGLDSNAPATAARPAVASLSSAITAADATAIATTGPSSIPDDRDAPATSLFPRPSSACSSTATPAAASITAIVDHRQLASSIVQGQPQPTSNLPSIHESSNPASPGRGDPVFHEASEDAGGDGDDENEDDSDSPNRQAARLRGLADDPSSLGLHTPNSAPTPGFLIRSPTGSSLRPQTLSRQQSLVSNRHTNLVHTLLLPASTTMGDGVAPSDGNMPIRKIWVKRPGASATLVPIKEDDLVDDVRDLILRKYANSLGRTFDSPDLTIRIHPREQQHRDRTLGPEEHMCRIIDAYFPGGQTVDEALIIDIPRRTPKASPRAPLHPYYTDDGRPSEAGEGYFPPVHSVPSPHLPLAVPATTGSHNLPHSISVLGTGQIPPIPSPGATGGRRAYRDRPERPRLGRTHTSSPTVLASGAPNPAPAVPPAASHDQPGHPPTAPPLPTSPGPEPIARTATPPLRTQSPRPGVRPRRTKKIPPEPQAVQPGAFSGGVPPINVLIVEDNPINLRLLEAFVKRLKVRWQTAMNGRDAVKKWRSGGFHLVLMDIMLPVMNGLEATREIRRLERVNSIGVFSSSPGSVVDDPNGELAEQDRLENLALFKSPVIVVALTASSLQSDRHEALAAGCNDFLTKPVNFVWLEQKVMEWGCMQALIDFDGWRKWKDFSQSGEDEAAKKAASAKLKTKKNRSSLTSVA
ncbi:hypothetical protein NLU13_0110 [Sarocladium strictum]|uniref:Response regulatory domain-containing protein n=1 Tax=Sarocladium strictum TaxID=5046 RepID=A0AA39GNS0_SARSR|nr:hypothetical protein NLU13_0110 [Sarocladium strictum]